MSIVHIQDINFKLTFGKEENIKLCILFNNTEEVYLDGYVSGQNYHLPTLIKDIKKTMNQYFRENNIDLELDFRKVYHHLFDFHVTSIPLFKAFVNARRASSDNYRYENAIVKTGDAIMKEKRKCINYYDQKDPLKFHIIYFKSFAKDDDKRIDRNIYQFPLLICKDPKIDYRDLMKSKLEVYIPNFDEVDKLADFREMTNEDIGII